MAINKTPPNSDKYQDPLGFIQANEPEQLSDYLSYANATDNQGRYWQYDEFYYRIEQGLNPELAWSLTRISRRARATNTDLPLAGYPQARLFLTPTIQKAMSTADRYTTNGALELMTSHIGEARHMDYLFNDLTEDEAISSSQLEGAATTTLVAKEILKKQRKPRSVDERMIVGNFHMMRFAWHKRSESLTPELISEMHKVGVAGIDDENYTPGMFRQNDDVVVEGPNGEVVHRPPPSEGLVGRLQQLCNWVNSCHDDAESSRFLHPLLKAICLHFTIGFEHPFLDGNGRVARALFYWFLFKSGYGALRYIAVSTLLKNAATSYAKSYLYTETDEMDLTYFVEYQCTIVMRAVKAFREAYDKALIDIQAFNRFLEESGLMDKLSDKQQLIFQVAQAGYARSFTVTEVKENLGCAYNTAATSLNGLVELKLFKKHKRGREWIYIMNDKANIKEQWS